MLKIAIAITAIIYSGTAWAQETWHAQGMGMKTERIVQELIGLKLDDDGRLWRTVPKDDIRCLLQGCKKAKSTECDLNTPEECMKRTFENLQARASSIRQDTVAMLVLPEAAEPVIPTLNPATGEGSDCRQLPWQKRQPVPEFDPEAFAEKLETETVESEENPFRWKEALFADYLTRSGAEDITACIMAERRLEKFRSFGEGEHTVRFTMSSEISECSGEDPDEISQSHFGLMNAYNSACLAKVESSVEAGWSKESNGRILRASGRLMPQDRPERACTATLAGGYLYTARHCLAYSGIIDEAENYTFEPYDGDTLEFPLEGRIRSTAYYDDKQPKIYDQTRPQDDVVAIDMRDFAPGGKGSITIGLAEPGEQLILPGLNLNAASTAAQDELVQSAGMDASSTCRVLYRSDQSCLVHSCQTESTTSGAPMIAVRGGRPVIVGIQVGYGTNGIVPGCTFDKDEKLPAAVNHAADPTRITLVP